MKLTKPQSEALRNIAEWERLFGPFHKERASKTRLAVRCNVLDKLYAAGLIDSAKPFPTSYYAVTLTEAGRALKEKP